MITNSITDIFKVFLEGHLRHPVVFREIFERLVVSELDAGHRSQDDHKSMENNQDACDHRPNIATFSLYPARYLLLHLYNLISMPRKSVNRTGLQTA